MASGAAGCIGAAAMGVSHPIGLHAIGKHPIGIGPVPGQYVQRAEQIGVFRAVKCAEAVGGIDFRHRRSLREAAGDDRNDTDRWDSRYWRAISRRSTDPMRTGCPGRCACWRTWLRRPCARGISPASDRQCQGISAEPIADSRQPFSHAETSRLRRYSIPSAEGQRLPCLARKRCRGRPAETSRPRSGSLPPAFQEAYRPAPGADRPASARRPSRQARFRLSIIGSAGFAPQ